MSPLLNMGEGRSRRTSGRQPDRWRARPVLARLLVLVLLLFPVAVSLGVTLAVRVLVPPPAGGIGRIAWWAALLVLAIVVAVGVERLARRGMPLVALLKMAMLFPDRAPTRFAVARKGGSIRQLQILAAQADGDPSPESSSASESAATILSLVTALSAHDRHSRGHSERVRMFTDMLGQELRLPEGDRDRLRWAALLHDIGKLSVRAGILTKPGLLDKEEWTTIRLHPAEGARIAAPLMAWLGPWGQTIHDHHERFDGHGYPDGLAGDAISRGGRIVAVTDAYDTMTSARSYRRPMATRAAREELARCAGDQFDPEYVRAFFAISVP
jgi:HD-GYP domain-containing protein (c-di-GMP phosphodiesterase class II)